MQKTIDKNQLNLFDNTMHGYIPIKQIKHIKFFGSDIGEEDQKDLKTQMQILVNKFSDGIFRSKIEWINETGFSDADRLLRFIKRGVVMGYRREKKKFAKRHWKYRIVKN